MANVAQLYETLHTRINARNST